MMATDTKTSTNPYGYEVPDNRNDHLKWWLSQLAGAEVRPPISETTLLTLQCSAMEKEHRKVAPELRENFALQVMEKRLTRLNVMTTPWLAVYLAYLSPNPAVAVMWSFAVKLYAIQDKVGTLDMPHFLNHHAKGLYTDQAFRKLWDQQKLASRDGASSSDNLLDYVKMLPHEAGQN